MSDLSDLYIDWNVLYAAMEGNDRQHVNHHNRDLTWYRLIGGEREKSAIDWSAIHTAMEGKTEQHTPVTESMGDIDEIDWDALIKAYEGRWHK